MRTLLATIIGLTLAVPAWADETKKTEPAKTEVKAPEKAEAAKTEVKTPASLPTEPATPKDAIDTGKKAIEAAKNHQWWYFSALVILVLMFVLKMVKVLDKIGRWKYVVLPVLSIGAALLAAFQGGVSLEIAIGVFATAWSTGMFQQLIEHGILGKPHTPGDGT